MIDNMTDQEKSVLLAKAMGAKWIIIPISDFDSIYDYSDEIVILDENDILIGHGTLYDPANMALAYMVLNWASERNEFQSDYHYSVIWGHWLIDWATKPPVDAQRAWLDKILSLAIEAGIVVVK